MGKKSKNLHATSGESPGFVLGPVLFLVIMNEKVDCWVALFADNSLMYQTIKCSHNTSKFQRNLTAFSKWAGKCGTDFNVK